MKTGVLHLKLKTDKVSDFKKVWEQFVGDLRKEVSGFQSALLLINPQTGNCTSIGFYDTAENAKALTSTAVYQRFQSAIRDFVVNEPRRELCDASGDFGLITGAEKAA